MGDGHWRDHRGLALAVRAAAVVAPFALSVLAGLGVGSLLPGSGSALWWLAVLAVSALALRLVDRLAHRLLPLAVLLELNLLFPERAPSRFRLALKSGSAKHVHEQIADGPTAETILTLVGALGAHHRPSRKHSERVRAYTELLAEELRLPEGDRHRLRWAALLHDIGKVDVPVEVLEGTGPLSEAGWTVIKRHPVDGGRLIEPLREWLGPWAGTVEQHHERWDGSGYPGGAAGEDICLGARMVAVADSFEAMTARRSYQEAMPLDAARARLAELAGTHFDPAVVRAFLGVSLGRLRWAYGPVSWLAEAPLLAFLGGLGPAAAAGARAGAAAVGVAVAAGSVGLSAPRPTEVAGVTLTRTATAAMVQAAAAESPTPIAPSQASPASRPTAPTTTTTTTTTGAAGGGPGLPPVVTAPGVTVTLPPAAPPVTVTLPTLPPVTAPTLPLHP